jgi:hypothetical protein
VSPQSSGSSQRILGRLCSFRRMLCCRFPGQIFCRRCHSPLADALSRGLWRMLCRRAASCSGGYFAAVVVFFRWMLCHRGFISPDGSLCVVCPCRSSRLGCGRGSSPYHVSFFLLCLLFLTTISVVLCAALWVLP